MSNTRKNANVKLLNSFKSNFFYVYQPDSNKEIETNLHNK